MSIDILLDVYHPKIPPLVTVKLNKGGANGFVVHQVGTSPDLG